MTKGKVDENLANSNHEFKRWRPKPFSLEMQIGKKSHTQKDPPPKEISDIDSHDIICWKTFPVHEGKADNTAVIRAFGNASMFSRKKMKFDLCNQIWLYRKLRGYPARLPPWRTAGSMPVHLTTDFRMWELCRVMPLVCVFPRGSPVSPFISFRRRSILTSVTIIGSQDLAVLKAAQIYSLRIIAARVQTRLPSIQGSVAGCIIFLRRRIPQIRAGTPRRQNVPGIGVQTEADTRGTQDQPKLPIHMWSDSGPFQCYEFCSECMDGAALHYTKEQREGPPGEYHVQGQEARERYGRQLHARLASHRSYEQGVQCFHLAHEIPIALRPPASSDTSRGFSSVLVSILWGKVAVRKTERGGCGKRESSATWRRTQTLSLTFISLSRGALAFHYTDPSFISPAHTSLLHSPARGRGCPAARPLASRRGEPGSIISGVDPLPRNNPRLMLGQFLATSYSRLPPHSCSSGGGGQWLNYSSSTEKKRVRFLAGSFPYFLLWESCLTMPLAGGFSRGSPVSLLPCIPAFLLTHLVSSSIPLLL
ncbi:hypothetical protein PR048_000106 [Dryococelus australis]|uniref:Uncharacterized protein n=1 Tax=Dryococelus australis TaxID=614101 RepID=A0ABQ9IDP2_9NEOP|nr:hypothetical protein PR048_000106 [Dryococelus australis]